MNNYDHSLALVIVNWNSGTHLHNCLQSIKNMSMQPDKLIIVDNASTDDSLACIKSLSLKVHLHINPDNTGFAEANNTAVRLAGDVDLIALLNPDAFPEPEWLRTMLEAASQYPDIGSFASRIIQNDNKSLLDSAGDSCLRSGIAVHRLQDSRIGDRVEKSCEVFAPCAAAALYRRMAFQEAGGFDASYFAYYEDVDLGMRLQLVGHKCLYVAGAVVSHVGGGTTGGPGNDISVYYNNRNFILTYIKNMPGRLLWFNLPRHLFAIAKGLLKALLTGKGRIVSRALGSALKQYPAAIMKRKKIQAKRKIPVKTFSDLLQ